MPKIREYKNDPGYYIYARPSDAGNITYGIDEAAYPIFDELGYEHEDPISWRIIQALKQAGLDDTDGEGTTPTSDPITFETEDSPDLTDQERFYELLNETKKLSAEDAKMVRETLGLEKGLTGGERSEFRLQDETSEEVGGHWCSQVEKILDKKIREAFPQMTTKDLLKGGKDDPRAISVTEMGADYKEDYIITLEEVGVDNGRVIEYQINTTSESVVIGMTNRVELSQEARAEAFSHAAIIDEVFKEYHPDLRGATPTVEIRF